MNTAFVSHFLELFILIVAVVTMISTVAIGVFAFRGWRETKELIDRLDRLEGRLKEEMLRREARATVFDLLLEKTTLIRSLIAKSRMQHLIVAIKPRIANNVLGAVADPDGQFLRMEGGINHIERLLAKNDYEQRLSASKREDRELALEALVQEYGDDRTVLMLERFIRFAPPDEAGRYETARKELLARLAKPWVSMS